MPDEITEDEILLDGMIPTGDLEEMYRKEASNRASARAAAVKPGVVPTAQQRVVVRPADYADKKEE